MSNKRKQDSSSQEEITTTEIVKRRRVDDDANNRLPNFYFSAAANILENDNLWEHQKQAYKKVHDYLCRNSSRSNLLLVVLPTGTGKSGVAHILPFGLKGRVLMITHNSDSCYQLMQNENFLHQRQVLYEGAAAPKVHIVQNQEDMIRLQENYSQYDLFIANIHKFDLGDKWKNTIGQFFQFIIIDEGHHVPAKIYNNVVMNQLLANSNINIILLTATPRRRDRVSLNAQIIYEYSMKQAVERKLIKHPCLLTYEPETITLQENGRTAQYQIRQAITYQLKRKIYQAMNRSKEVRSQLLVKMIKLIEEKRKETQTLHQAIIVCADQLDCDRVTMELNNEYTICGRPAVARSYHSQLSTPQRLQVQQDLKNKKCDVVVHCGLMNEGHDCPTISITLILCKIKWIGRFSQVVGRSIRYLPEKSLIDNTSHVIMNHFFVGKFWDLYKEEAVTTTKPIAAQESVTGQNTRQNAKVSSVIQKQREVRITSCQDTYTNHVSGPLDEEGSFTCMQQSRYKKSSLASQLLK